MAELMIVHGTIITMDDRRKIIRDGGIVWNDDRIVDIGKTEEVRSRNPGVEVIDAKGKIILPGLIDTHVHLTQTLARGLTDQVSVTDWLYERIFPYEQTLTGNDVYLNGLLSSLEMIRTGTTCFADPGGYQMEFAVKAIEDAGMRGILAIASVDEQDPKHPIPEHLLMDTDEVVRLNEELIRKHHGKRKGRIRAWPSLRGLLNVSKVLIERLYEMSEVYKTGIELHSAFWKDNVDWLKTSKGYSDIRYLDKLGVLGPNWLMSHMGWVDEEEIEIIKRHDIKVSYCPGPAMKMPLGTNVNKKIPKMINQGVNVSIGCDSTAANNSLDMFRAMWLTSTVHKEMFLDPMLITPEQALEMATTIGARCLLWDQEIGSLERGKKADLIIIDPHKSNLVPMHDFSVVPNIVYSGEGSNVETVIIDGKMIMENRKVLSFDENRVLEEAQKGAENILERLDYDLRPSWPTS